MGDFMIAGAAGKTTGNNILMPNNEPFDSEGVSMALVQINATAGISAGAITFEQSNDATNWVIIPATDVASITPAAAAAVYTIAASAVRLFGIQLTARYFRVRISTTFVGGSIRAIALMSDDTLNWNALGTQTIVFGSTQNINIAGAAGSNSNNGCTNFRRLATADTNLVSLKATAGRLYTLMAFNGSGAVKYLKIYNKASAPVLASDTPIFTIPLPAGQWTEAVNGELMGFYFATGIAYAITGAIGDTDATALAANDVVLMGKYA